MERRLRTLSRSGQRTRYPSLAWKYPQSRRRWTMSPRMTLVSLVTPRDNLSLNRSEGRLTTGPSVTASVSTCGLLETRRSHTGADDFHSFCGRNCSQESDAGQRLCAERDVPERASPAHLATTYTEPQNYAQLRKPVDKLCLDCHGTNVAERSTRSDVWSSTPITRTAAWESVRSVPHAEDRDKVSPAS